MRLSFVALLLVIGCDPTAATSPDLAPDQSATVNRGPTTLPVVFQPAGLVWDSAAQTLYIASDSGNQIIRWTDAGGFAAYATLPPPLAGLGQPIELPDGSLLITRFGSGKLGGIAQVRRDGTTEVPALDPVRRRLALARSADGTIYDSFFTVDSGNVHHGAIATIALGTGAEPIVVDNLSKPVGVVVVDGTLYVSDQDLDRIRQAPAAMPSLVSDLVPSIDQPDELVAGPSGVLYAGSKTGTVYRIAIASGAVTMVDDSFQATRGLCYDADNHRLFVSETATAAADGGPAMPPIHILPAD